MGGHAVSMCNYTQSTGGSSEDAPHGLDREDARPVGRVLRSICVDPAVVRCISATAVNVRRWR